MLCKGCGAEITSEQLYCQYCGTKNEAADPVSNQQNCNLQPNQITQGQMNPNQTSQGQMNPNQIPQGQIPPRQINPNMGMPNQMPPYQGMPNQIPPNQIPSNHMTSNPMGPGMIPPYPNPVPYSTGTKRGRIILAIVLGVVGVIFLTLGIIVVVGVAGYLKNTENKVEIIDDYVDNNDIDPSIEDSNEDEGIIGDDSYTDDTQYDMAYTYTELPDVMSIDSDYRFTYYDKYSEADYIAYTFLFNSMEATEDDFYTAVRDYCNLLTGINGFYYEEDFSADQYNESGTMTDYYSRDNIAIGVTASVEDGGWYAYVDLYDLTETEDSTEDSGVADGDTGDNSTSDSSIESDYYNYSYYINGRDTQTYDFSNEVIMENGVGFYLNDVTVTDLGDGTTQIDCNMDIAAMNADTYLYTDDFLLLPMDGEGYIIGDASLIEYVIDSNGEYMSMPYLLDTEYYYTYTVSFLVPVQTKTFSLYGTNLSAGYTVGPAYCMDLEVTQ